MTRKRNGATLTELIVALGILAVVVPIALRLLFATDRALDPQALKAAATGGTAQLMADLARDAMPARSASVSGATLAIGAPGRTITYTWSAQESRTIRSVEGVAGETRSYTGGQPAFSVRRNLLWVSVPTDTGRANTAIFMRN